MSSNRCDMPLTQTLNINNTTVYVKVSGQGQNCIFFLHGSSMSAAMWLSQLTNAALQKDFKLVAIDLPGHGNSQWLEKKEAYGLKEMTDVIRQIIEAFSPEKFVLTGLSYGTNIIGEITPPLKGCAGIMLVSPCIVNDQFPPSVVTTPGPMGHVIAAENPVDSDLRGYIYYGTKNTAVAERCINDFRKADPAFRQALGHIIINAGWTDELANIQQWQVPVCVAFGEEERLINTSYLNQYPPLWNRQVYRIENAGHFINEENTGVFNALLLQFSSSVLK